jgi:methyltransferase (TIGR00027 family)
MIPGLPSLTAEFVCLFRAREARRAAHARILDDHHAKDLLSPPMRALAGAPVAVVDAALNGMDPGLPTTIVCRHRFLDDHLVAALADRAHDTAQVLILGAGLDARALRFATALAGRPVFEIDFPATLARKRAQLSALVGDAWPAHLVQVGCDFARESFVDALDRQPRFVRGKPTLVIWEGVTMYLERAAVTRTLKDLAAVCGPGSALGLDFWFLVDGRDLKSRVQRLLPHVLGLIGEPVLFSLHPDDARGFLRGAGWDVVDAAGPDALRDRYVTDGRALVPSFHVAWAALQPAFSTAAP